MAIALRAAKASASATTSSTSIVMTVPTGVVNGDVMVMSISFRPSSVVPTLPSGWTSLSTSALAPGTLLAWRVASSEPTSYTVTTGTGTAAGVIIALSGASTTLPGSAQYSLKNNSTASTTITTNALGTFASSDGIDIFFGAEGGTSIVPAAPTNYTIPTNGNVTGPGSASTDLIAAVAYRALTGVTTVAALSATWAGTASGPNDGGHVFIMEAAGGGGTTPGLEGQFFTFF